MHPDKLISVLNDDLKTLQNWLNLNKQSLNAIKTKCMFIAGMSAGYCSYSSSTKSFTKECMHQQLFYNNSAGVLMYKILNEQSAPSLREKFIKIKDLNREYNLRSNDTDLALPKPKTNYLKRSFKYSGAMLWNSFPSEAKNASSLYQFKCSMPTIPDIKM